MDILASALFDGMIAYVAGYALLKGIIKIIAILNKPKQQSMATKI
jgi:hypothetical protein